MQLMYPLLLLLSLLQITTCTVYTVTPDDHYYPNTTCHHCHNLQHYLLNITKYFTSNTQLLFLPGLHHLHTHLIIQNVHNISLIGNGTTLNTLIQCAHIHTDTCITINNVSTLIIRNLTIKILIRQALNIIDCFSVSVNYLKVVDNRQYDSYIVLVGINIMGNSNFSHITTHGDINLLYNETQTDRQHVLTLDNCRVEKITIDMLQKSYRVTVKIANMYKSHTMHEIISAEELGTNEVLIINCQFISNSYNIHLFSFSSSSNGSVKFIKCQFENNKDDISFYLTSTWPWIKVNPSLIKLRSHVRIELKSCNFYARSTQTAAILQIQNRNMTTVTTAVIINTSFSLYTIGNVLGISDITFTTSLIKLSHINLHLEGSVVFSNITSPHSIISLKGNSRVIISGSVDFSYNKVHELINFHENEIKYVIMKENSVINIAHNKVWELFCH